MLGYVTDRVLKGIPLLIVISIIVFALIHAAPGGPDGVFAGDPTVSEEDLARIRASFGLDQPLQVQYLKWLGNMVTGDWGTSFQEKRPVLVMIAERVPNTLLLAGTATLIALLVSAPLAVYAASGRSAAIRQLVRLLTLLGVSVPTFWSGTMALLVFAGMLGVLPSGGMTTLGRPFAIGDLLRHLLLPSLILASLSIAQWVRYLNTALGTVLREDYVRTARAKGLSERTVVYRHALRNSLIPFVTIVVLQIPHMVSGAVVTEIVFSWPGVGRLVQTAILRHDYPLVMGAFTMMAALVIVASIAGDIVYAVADPRIRLRPGRAG
ncbi:MAG: ABC transporter permease [Anaerolineae bacterium]